MEDFKSDLDALRIKRAAFEEQLRKGKAMPGHCRISFAKLTRRLQPSKRPLRTKMRRETRRQCKRQRPTAPHLATGDYQPGVCYKYPSLLRRTEQLLRLR